MFKKTFMILLYLALGYQAKASFLNREPASARNQASASHTICSMDAGDTDKIKFRATTRKQAFSAVTEDCLQARISRYKSKHLSDPDQDTMIYYVQKCANSVSCFETR